MCKHQEILQSVGAMRSVHCVLNSCIVLDYDKQLTYSFKGVGVHQDFLEIEFKLFMIERSESYHKIFTK